MENKTIEIAVEINAPLIKVWNVFTDPFQARQMGGYYDTDWEVGSSFGFKMADGRLVTDGVLLEFQAGCLIKHSLFESGSRNIMAVITYKFENNIAGTLLTGTEELMNSINDTLFTQAVKGWTSLMNIVKELAEAG